MLICGIDEVARGPALGPMIVCAVVIDDSGLPLLKKYRVRDSKKVSKCARGFIYKKLYDENVIKRAIVYIIPANVIDGQNINKIEEKIVYDIVSDLRRTGVKKIFIDKFSHNIVGGKDIICEYHADAKYRVVGAASIIAKVLRDNMMVGYSRMTGKNLGSGYPADSITVKYLKEEYKKTGQFPKIARKSWGTCKRIRKEI